MSPDMVSHLQHGIALDQARSLPGSGAGGTK
jgi:hypothetical protein